MTEVLKYNAKQHFNIPNVNNFYTEGQNLRTEIGLWQKTDGTLGFRVKHTTPMEPFLSFSSVPSSSITSYEMLLKTATGQSRSIPFTLKQGISASDVFEFEVNIPKDYAGADIIGFDIMGGIYHLDSFLAIANIKHRINSGANGILVMNLSSPIKLKIEYFNNFPTVSLQSPSSNLILYENETMNITGDAYDVDKDQSVTAYFQINDEPKKVLATNLSQTQISLSKQLTFKNGKLYDGNTTLTGTLTEGVEHKLKVWAVDSENGQSATVERSFYVVPNRAPILSIDAVVPSGIINTDKFTINGTATDQDANSSVKVNHRINGANPVEIYNGTGGTWEFDVSLSQLLVGENTIIIEVIDNYGAKTSKTIKLKKNEIKTPILQSVARYKIEPPKGSAKGVLLFIERDEEVDLKVELSMTLAGEQEQYETLTANNTAPMPNTNGIVEDTFYYEATEPKDNIILKISTTRPDATVNHKIHLISGAVE